MTIILYLLSAEEKPKTHLNAVTASMQWQLLHRTALLLKWQCIDNCVSHCSHMHNMVCKCMAALQAYAVFFTKHAGHGLWVCAGYSDRPSYSRRRSYTPSPRRGRSYSRSRSPAERRRSYSRSASMVFCFHPVMHQRACNNVTGYRCSYLWMESCWVWLRWWVEVFQTPYARVVWVRPCARSSHVAVGVLTATARLVVSGNVMYPIWLQCSFLSSFSHAQQLSFTAMDSVYSCVVG